MSRPMRESNSRTRERRGIAAAAPVALYRPRRQVRAGELWALSTRRRFEEEGA